MRTFETTMDSNLDLIDDEPIKNVEQKDSFFSKAKTLLSNPDIQKRIGKGMLKTAMSIAGIKSVFDIKDYIQQSRQVRGMFGEGKGLSGSVEELANLSMGENNQKGDISAALKDMNMRLAMTKEGEQRGSQQRMMIKDLLVESRKLKREARQSQAKDAVQDLEGGSYENGQFVEDAENFSINEQENIVDLEGGAYGEKGAILDSENFSTNEQGKVLDLEGGAYKENILDSESFSERVEEVKKGENPVARKMVEEYEQRKEIQLEKTREKMREVLDSYTTQKVTGMQAARESLNTACVVTGAFAFRPLGYGLMDGVERYQNLKKEARIKNGNGEEAKDPKIFKDVIWGSIKETIQKAFLMDSSQEKGDKSKVGLKKGIDFLSAWGKIARYAGFGIMAEKHPENLAQAANSVINLFSSDAIADEVGHNFTNNLERVSHVSLFSGNETGRSSFEAVHSMEHGQPSVGEQNQLRMDGSNSSGVGTLGKEANPYAGINHDNAIFPEERPRNFAPLQPQKAPEGFAGLNHDNVIFNKPNSGINHDNVIFKENPYQGINHDNAVFSDEHPKSRETFVTDSHGKVVHQHPKEIHHTTKEIHHVKGNQAHNHEHGNAHGKKIDKADKVLTGKESFHDKPPVSEVVKNSHQAEINSLEQQKAALRETIKKLENVESENQLSHAQQELERVRTEMSPILKWQLAGGQEMDANKYDESIKELGRLQADEKRLVEEIEGYQKEVNFAHVALADSRHRLGEVDKNLENLKGIDDGHTSVAHGETPSANVHEAVSQNAPKSSEAQNVETFKQHHFEPTIKVEHGSVDFSHDKNGNLIVSGFRNAVIVKETTGRELFREGYLPNATTLADARSIICELKIQEEFAKAGYVSEANALSKHIKDHMERVQRSAGGPVFDLNKISSLSKSFFSKSA